MTAMETINDLFEKLLANYSNGIANTSTRKYSEIRTYIARELSLAVDDVYATGATTRISNFDTRLAQGNQRGQHADLAVAFLKADVGNTENLASDMSRLQESFSATCNKFVNGEERGTVYDGILGFVQLDLEAVLRPLRFICVVGCAYKDKVLQMFPDIDVQEISRVNVQTPVRARVNPRPARIASGSATDLLVACEEDLTSAGMRLSPGLLGRYISALITKRFVLLAGLSGSGKTKLALMVARWLCESSSQVAVVAVGADWTSNENVLGYRDALDDDRYRSPSNGALDLIIEAANDPDRPYFLIMDEMNLSHVERYFADLLSSFESGEPIALHAGSGPVDGVPPRILVPANLFIIGTVNVDETTYMFSPKVLDRANVIEFRVSVDDIAAFLENPMSLDVGSISGAGSQFGLEFVSMASAPMADLDAGKPDVELERRHAKLNEALQATFEILSPIGAEFGYRTAIEVRRFVSVHASIVGDTWGVDDAIDAQVLQKILPKIHGSERRIRPVLEKLALYLEEGGYPMSLDKVRRMQERLREGFVSYLD